MRHAFKYRNLTLLTSATLNELLTHILDLRLKILDLYNTILTQKIRANLDDGESFVVSILIVI